MVLVLCRPARRVCTGFNWMRWCEQTFSANPMVLCSRPSIWFSLALSTRVLWCVNLSEPVSANNNEQPSYLHCMPMYIMYVQHPIWYWLHQHSEIISTAGMPLPKFPSSLSHRFPFGLFNKGPGMERQDKTGHSESAGKRKRINMHIIYYCVVIYRAYIIYIIYIYYIYIIYII